MNMRKDDKPWQYGGVQRRKHSMNWKDDFAEGFKTGEKNELSLGMVMLFVLALCAIGAGLLIIFLSGL